MKLAATYNSVDAEFKTGVEVSIHSVNDNFAEKKCDVYVALKSATVDAVRGVGSFDYTGTWEDSDVINFIKTKMEIE